MKKLLQTIKVIFTAAAPVEDANDVTIAAHRSGRLTQINRKPREDSCRPVTFNRACFGPRWCPTPRRRRSDPIGVI